MSNKFIIIIPCYNEFNRINIDQYSSELRKNDEISLLFVNDGSKDKTSEKISELKKIFPTRIHSLEKIKNEGKAAAVYDGFRHALENYDYLYLGYIDADLAVSIDEITRVKNITLSENKVFGFGSRWKRIGSKIERKLSRHILGRIFATIASILLDLGVYDTQCGAKIFEKEIASKVFDKPFNVNWNFDVEIFFRLLQIFPKEKFEQFCIEIPLNCWKDIEGSKVKITDSIRVIKDFIVLRKIYKK